MEKQTNPTILFIFILFVGLTSFSCDLSETGTTEEVTVTINLTLPAGTDVSGKTWEIVFITDTSSLSTGNFDYYSIGTCGSGTTITITMTDVSPDTYYLFASIYMGQQGTSGPQAGDYVGVYGVTNPEDLTSPNATIPATGTATFNITMFLMEDGNDGGYESSIIYGNLILPAAANGKEWSVYLDSDLNQENGCVADEYGTCGTSATVTYGIETAPAGTYYLYAVVHVVGTPGTPPIGGDYYGQIESVTIPATGQIIRDIQLSLFGTP